MIREAYSSGFGLVFMKDGAYSGPIFPIIIMSNNKGPSEGIVFAHEDYFVYIPNFATDIPIILDGFVECLTNLKTSINTIANMVSSMQPLPTVAVAGTPVPTTISATIIPQIQTIILQMILLKTKMTVLQNLLK